MQKWHLILIFILISSMLLLLLPILVVAAVDVVIQWFSFSKKMKMSQEEMTQER